MIVALFTNRPRAEAALRELKAAGFTDNDLGMIMRDLGKPGFHDDSLVGGLMTILGSLPVPGLGPLLVGGALASSLTAGDAAFGARALTKILGSPQAADAGRAHFEKGLREGGIVVTVQAAERSLQATHILQAHSADFGPQNRRLRNDPQYAGPERRLVGV
jgi:hypothetical protein